jgi:hypothetical protein
MAVPFSPFVDSETASGKGALGQTIGRESLTWPFVGGAGSRRCQLPHRHPPVNDVADHHTRFNRPLIQPERGLFIPEPEGKTMNTTVLLIVQYDAQTVIPIDKVVRDFFPHLSVQLFTRKVALGDINIPLIRIDTDTRQSAKGVHINDLAAYIDLRRAAAIKEAKQLSGVAL